MSKIYIYQDDNGEIKGVSLGKTSDERFIEIDETNPDYELALQFLDNIYSE